MKINALMLVLIAAILGSCVPARQLEEVKAKQKQCEEQNEKLLAQNIDLKGKVDEFTSQLAEFSKKIQNLETDTTLLGSTLRRLTNNYDKLNQTYELLLDKNKDLLAGNAADNKKLVSQLQSTQEDLQNREDELRKLEKALAERETNLERITIENKNSKSELQKREAKIKEMEAILSRKDSVAKALRDKVSDALLGFQNNGLTVEMKNGKVYVSLEERLLFASGKWEVDAKGQDALKKLAKAIETQEELNIMIEGHTDNVPYNGTSNIKDNWDLSVVRATAIVKILLSNSKLKPKQITAAGRGEFVPLDSENTPEAKRKNRRTEIIISPKLDELFQILENN